MEDFSIQKCLKNPIQLAMDWMFLALHSYVLLEAHQNHFINQETTEMLLQLPLALMSPTLQTTMPSSTRTRISGALSTLLILALPQAICMVVGTCTILPVSWYQSTGIVKIYSIQAAVCIWCSNRKIQLL